MFTGIIEGQGKIAAIRKNGLDCRFVIEPLFTVDDWERGESVAVNGACLSVEQFGGKEFTVYASMETLSVTNLKFLLQGSLVNLERAVKVGQRLGGHLVSGHVDCIAIVKNILPAGQSRKIRLDFPSSFAAQVIPKGSIALDGISLTVNDCGNDFLEVNIIPDTYGRTNIDRWRTGDKINMETDMIGKYVLRSLKIEENGKQEVLTDSFLLENGFI